MSFEAKILFSGPNLNIGRFRCQSNSELWTTENRTGDFPMFVFPRTAVEIHQADRPSVVATPNQVMFYNSRHSYRRDLIDPRGDVCEFFSVSPLFLQDVLKSIGAKLPSDLYAPFKFSHGPCAAEIYLAQRTLFRTVEQEQNYCPVFVEESFCHLLPRLLERALKFHEPFAQRKKHLNPVRLDQVEAVKDFIAREHKSKLSIQEIADYAECSVYHLCRVFKELTGQSIYSFLTQFRVRSAVERILDYDHPLTEIALDYRFSSHSHFSNTFRRVFDTSPKHLRHTDSVSFLKQLLAKNS